MFFWIATLLYCSQFLCLKAHLDVLYHDFIFSYHDPDYFKDLDSSVWENYFHINVTLTNYLPVDAEIRLQLIGATMGEYIVPTGVDGSYSIIDACDEPIFFANTFRYFNSSLENCPPKPGNYIAEGHFDDLANYPDSFPPNNYVMRTTIFTPEKELLVMECYQRIS